MDQQAPNGYECFNCEFIVQDEYLIELGDEPECEQCGSYTTGLVYIEPCPADDPDACNSEYHHYGIGDHVVSLES